MMNQETLEIIFKKTVMDSNGSHGFVEASHHRVPIYLISDINFDRMRIISPIKEYEQLSNDEVDRLLESNFHDALDARYAVSEGVVYAVYIHPLSTLTEAQVESAVEQVTSLVLTFGREYTSGVLTYRGK